MAAKTDLTPRKIARGRKMDLDKGYPKRVQLPYGDREGTIVTKDQPPAYVKPTLTKPIDELITNLASDLSKGRGGAKRKRTD